MVSRGRFRILDLGFDLPVRGLVHLSHFFLQVSYKKQ